MKTFCGAFPILSGKTEAGREFAKTVMGPKRSGYLQALKEQGISKISWFLQNTPQGDMLIVHFEADDVEKVFEVLANSKDSFHVWFKEQVKSVIGLDLEQPSDEPPPEEIVHV